ncbi:hypothetical protein RNZ50_10935 [Paracoccaceae bacterium Fryx2]|nr:hypothetical protein [Paracoccaceae bacterium Fryx2]
MKDLDENIGDLLHPAHFPAQHADTSQSRTRPALRRQLCRAALVAADAASLVAAFGLLAGLGAVDGSAPAFLRGLVFASLTTIALYAAVSLYPGYRLHQHELLRRRVLASTVRISRRMGADFARSWARVSRHSGQSFHGIVGRLADAFMESGLNDLVKLFCDGGAPAQAFT